MFALLTGSTNTVSTVIDSMTTGLQNAGSDLLGGVASIVPVALPVMISIVAVGVGIKIFRKVTGR